MTVMLAKTVINQLTVNYEPFAAVVVDSMCWVFPKDQTRIKS